MQELQLELKFRKMSLYVNWMLYVVVHSDMYILKIILGSEKNMIIVVGAVLMAGPLLTIFCCCRY
jgi:hypothetical protein